MKTENMKVKEISLWVLIGVIIGIIVGGGINPYTMRVNPMGLALRINRLTGQTWVLLQDPDGSWKWIKVQIQNPDGSVITSITTP